MTYKAVCCGVRVIGRLVWIALGVMEPEEKCPECGRWTKFVAEGLPAEKPVFGSRRAA